MASCVTRAAFFQYNLLLLSLLQIIVSVILLCGCQMGAYHTLDLEMNRKFTLQKSEWDSVALERIGNLCF